MNSPSISSGLLPIPNRHVLQQHLNWNDMIMGKTRSFDHCPCFSLTNTDALPAPKTFLVVHFNLTTRDRICFEHADLKAFPAFFRSNALFRELPDNVGPWIHHFSRNRIGSRQNADILVTVTNDKMPLTGLHTEIQGMDQTRIAALFKNNHGFIDIDDFIAQIKTKINIGPVENDNVLAGRLLQTIQRHLTNTWPHGQAGRILVAFETIDVAEELVAD